MRRLERRDRARRIGGAEARGWVKRFSDARRLGPYLKVLRSGRVTAGDEIVIEYRPEGAPTILDVYRERGVAFEIDGIGTLDEVFERIITALAERGIVA